MKNLANCTPVEFLKQTNKIRHAVQTWLKDTKILDIRKNKPVFVQITEGMTEEEKDNALLENKRRAREQAMKNISDMLDVALEENTEKTLELLGMMCFIEPADVYDYKVPVLLKEFWQMLSDKDIIDFFTSLMRLDQTGTSEQSEK